MSTLKVDAIRHNSATSDAITTAADGTCTAKLTSVGGQQLSNRNLLINGDMQISERNGTTSTAYTNAQYSLDRWQIVNDNASSRFTTQQVTDAPVGFYHSLKMTSSSAHTPLSGEVFGVGQKIEGYNTNWLEFGTSNAKSITISFFVKSSLTGTFGGSVLNHGMTRGFPWTYTISSANTWERKTVTVVGCPDGTWDPFNTTGIRVHWSMGAHANRSDTAGQWSSTTYSFHPTGATDVVATNGATLQITGCQVEVGDTATTFEHRNIGDELLRCKRYYYQETRSGTTGGNGAGIFALGMTANSSGGSIYATMNHPVEMRTAPTVTFSGTFAAHRFGVAINQITAANMNGGAYHNSTTATTISGTNSGSTPGQGTLAFLEGVPGTIMFSAEL